MPLLSSDYQLARRIAVSDLAEVLLASQRSFGGLERLVVIKRILPHVRADLQFAQVYLQEMRLIAALKHHNIAEIYDVHHDEQDLFVVMEYLSGEDLGFMARAGSAGALTVPAPIACRIIAQAADGLDYAHNATDPEGIPLGILHRGLTPGNIIVTYGGAAKITDFGLDRADAQSAYARPSTLRLKLAYRPPERIQHREVDQRSDVYALGVMLYELLVGRRLFKGDTEAAVLRSVMELRVPPPRQLNAELPAALDELVMQAIERDPQQRISSARELREGLDNALAKSRAFASEHEVGAWMRSVLATRFAERQRLERVVAAETRETSRVSAVTGELPAMFSAVGSGGDTNLTPSAALSVSSMISNAPPSQIQRIYAPPNNRTRTLTVTLVASLVVLLLVVLFAAAYIIGKRQSQGTGLASQSGDSTVVMRPTAAAAGQVLVHVFPEGAAVTADGRQISDSVGIAGVLVPAQPGRPVRIEVSKEGYLSHEQQVVGSPEGLKHVYVNLQRRSQ